MAATGIQQGQPRPNLKSLIGASPLIIATAVVAGPTFYRLGDQVWTKEIGAHGPIVLATGIWLLWRQWGAMTAAAAQGNAVLTITAAVASLAAYVFGRAYDFISIESLGLYS